MWQVVITKCVRYYKVWQTLLQSASGIIKCDSYYKVRGNSSQQNDGIDKILCCTSQFFMFQLKKQLDNIDNIVKTGTIGAL